VDRETLKMETGMKSWHLPDRRRLSIVLLLLLIPVCVLVLWKLASATALGKGDFIGYWSAAYLLHEGHNPYDPAGMMEIRQTLIHSGLDFVVMAWNPPTLFVFMLPLAWLFARKQSAVNLETAVALSTVITVPATFYGWSYDQSILLIPMAQIISWLLLPSHPTLRIAVIAAVLFSILLNWIQRIVNTGEVYYFWIPIFWAGVYGICLAANKAPGSAKSSVEPA
jgi:hypothetical protein